MWVRQRRRHPVGDNDDQDNQNNQLREKHSFAYTA